MYLHGTIGMDGCTTIRVFGKISYFQNLFKSCVDKNTAAMMNFLASQRWLGARFQILGSVVVLFGTSFVVCFNDRLKLETGIIAILIIWSNHFTITLGFFSQAVSDTEAYLTSVERLQGMTQLPQEANHETSNSITLKSSWPEQGNLSFEEVCLKYRPGLPLALNGLTFAAKAGQRIGVCGRTGAGKSTITAALFRLCELESGKITLDGQDLSKLGLADVRGRKNGMCIIPQDPVLFSGSLRECLDPWGISSDDDIVEALRSVQVADAESRGVQALEDFVDEGGRNFSVGERQLLCLARAVLAKPKVLVLDEATASVDGETDAFIQQMIRKRFSGTTMLTIAHRLNTIMDYDAVLVMDKGKVAEFGSPKELLEDDNGLFSNLVDSTGNESSLALRQMANNAT
jgi:ABC-type multidrug transport system fused ATPase/permease subunit